MLKIQNLTKIYPGGKKAVDNFSLEVAPGKIYGFIGPNGAGKTTTIKCCTGILNFDQGEIFVEGISLKDDLVAAKRIMAYVPDNPDLYDYLTGIQYLNFISDIYEVSQEMRRQNIMEYAEAFGLNQDLQDLIGSYSHGMKQKLALIGAFVHQPRLLILDEPFVGLDPKSFHILKELMNRLCESGSSVFFSSHILDVVEKICEHIAIIQQGRLIYSGTMSEVRGNQSLESIFLEMTDDERN